MTVWAPGAKVVVKRPLNSGFGPKSGLRPKSPLHSMRRLSGPSTSIGSVLARMTTSAIGKPRTTASGWSRTSNAVTLNLVPIDASPFQFTFGFSGPAYHLEIFIGDGSPRFKKGVSISSNRLMAETSSESRPRPRRGSVRGPEFRRAARRGFAPRERTAKAPPGPYLGRCSRAAGPRRTSSACCPSREGCSRSARHHRRQP